MKSRRMQDGSLFALAAVLLLGTIVAGCDSETPPRAEAPPVLPQTGSIRGFVSDRESNSPVPRAVVRTEPPTSVMVLDDLGRYVIQGAAPGRYVVIAEKEGYAQGRAEVAVTAGNTTVADITLIRPPRPKEKKLLYLKEGDPSQWTVQGEPLHQHEEIERWKAAGYVVTTRDITTTRITRELLDEYAVLRFNGSHYFGKRPTTPEEGEAVYRWVLDGGRMFADIYNSNSVPLAAKFGVEGIQSSERSGRPWPYYHGAPLTVGPVSGDVFSVERLAAEQLDRVSLAPEHQLTVAAEYDGYPAVVHGRFDGGKVVFVFLCNWSHDATNPGNAYRADIFQHGNLKFVEQVIRYLGE